MATGDTRVIKLLNDFTVLGPNGKHICMVFELMGSHVLTLIRRSDHTGLPINQVKHIIREVSLVSSKVNEWARPLIRR